MHQEQHNILKRFFNYIGNKLTDKERHMLEREAMKHPFEEDALEGFTNIEYENALNDLDELNEKLFKEKKTNKDFFYLKIAAGVLIIFSLSTLLYYFMETEQVFDIAQQIDTTYQKENVEIVKPDTFETKTPSKDIKKGRKAKQQKTVKKVVTTKPVLEKEEIEELTIDEEFDLADIEEEVLNEQNISFYDAEMEAKSTISMEKSAEPIKSDNLQTVETSRVKKKMTVTEQKDKQIITGTVTDQSGEGFPGVTVVLKGTSVGTVTDLDGKFSLNVGETTNDQTLTFAFIGYDTEEVKVSEFDNYIALNENVEELEEVVVIGYGATKKSDLTGSISTISAEDIAVQGNGGGGSYSVTCKPMPNDGKLAYNRYIKKNIQFPESAEDMVDEEVNLSFYVGADSIPNQIKVLSSPGDEYSNIAVKLIKEGPKWIPCPNNLSKQVTYTVKFKR